ncbi:substrate-binding domain-containing protein [Roseofilum capinflatum]|uniref:Substrate-binding domain-containing protein n=1 Tax=Roseofilum capinflatum BLCC-M114 TaxID=3022440 RepID=A0ABT7B1R1_9CYAN|nr:substrate-binding domain-containing protein [Roseofilum capinflatum]MDJ1173099.1 substrate-binding domain-containing protein [Roseofilum capinflatum BLCC-M114]
MAQNNDPSPFLFIGLFLILGAGGGYWFFLRQPPSPSGDNPPVVSEPNAAPTPTEQTAPNSSTPEFTQPTSVAAGTVIRMDGSTSMVTLNRTLKQGFEGQFPNTTVETQANGSDKGIQGVLMGQLDLAAVSRPLSAQETQEGLMAFPVTSDQIAIAVSNSNPLSAGLTMQQVKDIFQGKITNWSEVGGSNRPIRVINRPVVSGTRQAFQELALQGENFGTGSNVATLDRDATTPMLQALGEDGIGYATADQIVNQQTVRAVAIDGVLPGFSGYPYSRTLYYVYKSPPNEAVTAFLGYVDSMN